MNRYNDFEHRSYERATRGGDYSRASGSAGYATSSPNLDISDHKREERPRRIRSRRAANFQSLYPSVHNLPDIPSAAVVFSKVGRKRAPETTETATSNDERQSTFESHHHHQAQHPSSPNPVEEDEGAVPFDRPLVEVAPGHWVELRGSEETWAALQRGFSRKLNCFCCETSMKVIADAAMVLCPECRMICPLESEGGAEGTGLGLGVKVQKLPEEEEISAASFHSEKSCISHKGKKDGELKDDTDSGHSIHCKRPPTTNLGARTSPSRERSESPRVVSNYR